MTYRPSQIGEMVSVDTSSELNQFQAPLSYGPNGSGQPQNQDFTLPESCPLVFADPAPPQTQNPTRNGFFKMADFVSDFKDRRAQASFVRTYSDTWLEPTTDFAQAQDNPISRLIGPKPGFTSKYADPGYASSGRAQNDVPRLPQRQEDKKRPGMLKGMKEKVMHSVSSISTPDVDPSWSLLTPIQDVLYLIIVNNPTDSASPPIPDPPQSVAERGTSTYQYGPPPHPRTHTPSTQDQYQLVYGSLTGHQRYNELNEYGSSNNNIQIPTQGSSTYQYGPPPLPSKFSTPPQWLHPQRSSKTDTRYILEAQVDRSLNRDREYEYETETEKRQIEEKEEYCPGEQHPDRNVQQYAASIPVSTAPPVYTP